jgi:hypothetical protein
MLDKVKAAAVIQFISPADVLTVYSGKPGCMCGCNGKYFITAQNRAAAARDRGYEYEDDQVNEKMVRKVIRLVKAAAGDKNVRGDDGREPVGSVTVGDAFMYVFLRVSERRVYSLYLTKEAQARLTEQCEGPS